MSVITDVFKTLLGKKLKDRHRREHIDINNEKSITHFGDMPLESFDVIPDEMVALQVFSTSVPIAVI